MKMEGEGMVDYLAYHENNKYRDIKYDEVHSRLSDAWAKKSRDLQKRRWKRLKMKERELGRSFDKPKQIKLSYN
jgi:hypothetical protein